MSLSGALTTAVTGLDGQSAALGAISNNVANSATSGYKRVETAFSTLISVANAQQFQPGGVVSKPIYTNDIGGPIQQTSVQTNLALSGDGFFVVNAANGTQTNGVPIFNNTQLYTRSGNFSLDSTGFLQNSAGYYLDGWPIDQLTGSVQKNSLQPIRIATFKDNPQPTANITYAANLPTNINTSLDTDTTTPDVDYAPTPVQFFDAVGQAHSLNVGWTKISGTNNTWTLNVTSSEPGVTITSPAGPVNVDFNIDNSMGAAGSILNFNGTTGTIGTDIALPIQVDFAGPAASTQNLNLNLGKFGVAEQTTMFTGSDIEFRSANQDGLAPGSFKSLSIDEHGVVTLNYDNGARRNFFQIPIATFSDANGLQSESGNAFSTTVNSGTPIYNDAGANGAGTLIPSAIEGSNVDIASEFTKMIQTQSAYGANSRVITATAQLLQQTNDMIR
jgi:flagellar hook protein FlgE